MSSSTLDILIKCALFTFQQWGKIVKLSTNLEMAKFKTNLSLEDNWPPRKYFNLYENELLIQT